MGSASSSSSSTNRFVGWSLNEKRKRWMKVEMDVLPNEFVISPCFVSHVRMDIPLKYIITVRHKEDLIELLINIRDTYKYWHPLQCSRAPELFQEICQAIQRYALAHSVPVQPKLSLVNAARPSHRSTTAASNREGISASRLPLQSTVVDAGYEIAWNFTATPQPPVGLSSFKGTLQSDSFVGNSVLAAQNGKALVPHASNDEECRAGDNRKYGGYIWNGLEFK